jgi:hypothetical protein
MAAAQLEHQPPAPLQLDLLLSQFDRPLPAVTHYDQLLVGAR